MDACLQNILPDIAKVLDKEYIEGECCVTCRPEKYLQERAALHFTYNDPKTQIQNLHRSIQYSKLEDKYRHALKSVITMLHENSQAFELESYDNVFVLFGFYCPLHLKNSAKDSAVQKNLLVYIVLNPQVSMWNTVCSWSGVNGMRKYLGYNNYLPGDQY